MQETFISTTVEETYEFGKKLASIASPGEIYLLTGDLGTGKTVFTKGFAAGLGVREYITSPTFNIIKEYHSGRLPLYHFDLYRLSDEDELYVIGADEYWNSDGVCVIEWADMFPDIVWENAVSIEIKKDLSNGPDCRIITVSGGKEC